MFLSFVSLCFLLVFELSISLFPLLLSVLLFFLGSKRGRRVRPTTAGNEYPGKLTPFVPMTCIEVAREVSSAVMISGSQEESHPCLRF